MGSVTIGLVTYSVYGDVAGATSYLAASLSAGTTWTGASDTVKAQAMVTATRILDELTWPGTRTAPDQDLAWPRVGAVDAEGQPIPDDEIPEAVILACYEMLCPLIRDATAFDAPAGGSNVRRVKAGTAEVEFFDAVTQTRFPLRIQNLIGPLMGTVSSDDSSSVTASGECVDSQFEPWDVFRRRVL